MTIVKIKNTSFTIDDEDVELISHYSWRLHPQGYIHGYSRGPNRKSVRLHRVVTNAPAGVEVDHIDFDKANNQKSNLRFCNRQQNKANTGIISTNTTGYKGVSVQDGKYQASIRVSGRLIYLGRYDAKEEAAHVYNQVAEQVFGEFAWLNKIR